MIPKSSSSTISSLRTFDSCRDKTVLVTGGTGLLGSYVVESLQQNGVIRIVVPRSAEYDLRDPGHTRELFEHYRPHGVIHLAAVVGGIGANRESPGAFLHDNALNRIERDRSVSTVRSR